MEEQNDISFFILDDNKDLLQIIKMHLDEKREKNYKCFHYYEDLLREVKRERPDLVFIDFQLGSRYNGYDIMKMVREINPACQFVFMSSLMSIDELKVINNEGCGYFVNKTKNFLADFDKALIFERDKIQRLRARNSTLSNSISLLDNVLDKNNKHLEENSNGRDSKNDSAGAS